MKLDGVRGKQTINLIKHFQQSHKLKDSGDVDENTAFHLRTKTPPGKVAESTPTELKTENSSSDITPQTQSEEVLALFDLKPGIVKFRG